MKNTHTREDAHAPRCTSLSVHCRCRPSRRRSTCERRAGAAAVHRGARAVAMPSAASIAWHHFLHGDGVVARRWECHSYATDTVGGLERCARQERSKSNAAGSILRWDAPSNTWMSIETVPTEKELAADNFRGVGKFGLPTASSSRPVAMAFGSLFWAKSVPRHRRGYGYPHDAWYTAESTPQPREKECPPDWRSADYVAGKLSNWDPRKWQCHHADWNKVMADYSAWAMHTAAVAPEGCMGHNQVHLSWQEDEIDALFYVNASNHYTPGSIGTMAISSGAVNETLRRDARTLPLLHAAALEAAARAQEKLQHVVARVNGYARKPIVQLLLDAKCGVAARGGAKHMLDRIAVLADVRRGAVHAPVHAPVDAMGVPPPDVAAQRLQAHPHLRTFAESAAAPPFQAPVGAGAFRTPFERTVRTRGWLGDVDGLGPRTRCNLTILVATFGVSGRQLGPTGGSCWPRPNRAAMFDAEDVGVFVEDISEADAWTIRGSQLSAATLTKGILALTPRAARSAKGTLALLDAPPQPTSPWSTARGSNAQPTTANLLGVPLLSEAARKRWHDLWRIKGTPWFDRPAP